MNMRTVLRYVLLLLLAAALASWMRGCVRIDTCLDRGGAWNDKLGVCDGASV
jgi:hypothetical protein